MLSDEEKERILELEGQGLSSYAIGKALNRDPKTIASFLKDSEEREAILPPKNNRRHKSKGGRPLVQDPSPQLKEKRELAEAMDLEVAIEERVKELKEMKGIDDSIVKQAENEAKVEESSVRKIKAKKERRELEKDDKVEEEKERRRELVERMKSELIPWPLRDFLPAPILLLTLNTLTMELAKLDMTLFSEREIQAYAMCVRDRIWCDPQYYRTVKFSQFQASCKLRDEYLQQAYSGYVTTRENALREALSMEEIPPEAIEVALKMRPPMTFNQWYVWILYDLSARCPEKAKELFTAMGEFHYATGGGAKVREVQIALQGIGKYVEENDLPF